MTTFTVYTNVTYQGTITAGTPEDAEKMVRAAFPHGHSVVIRNATLDMVEQVDINVEVE